MIPSILEVAALTSAVIRNQVQDMMQAVMAVCPCVEAIPLILQPLDASNKSKTVRESCVNAGRQAFEWDEILGAPRPENVIVPCPERKRPHPD